VIEVRSNLEMIGKGDVDDLPKGSLYRAGIANEYDTCDKLGFVRPAVDDFTSHRHKNPKLQRMTTERSKPFPPLSSHLPPYRLNTETIDPMRRSGHPVRPRATKTSNSASSLPTPPTSSTVCVGHGTLSGQVPIASTLGRSLTPMKRPTAQLPAITDSSKTREIYKCTLRSLGKLARAA
jgi:hypothetical protein